MANALEWHDEAVISGIRVRAHFFNPAVVDARADFVARNLPVFKSARPKVLVTENDRKNFVAGDLIGQPDSVLEHGAGLISLEYKSNSGRSHECDSWRRSLRLTSMLQCIGGAMVVAGHYGRPTAAIIRSHNVIYHLAPRQEVLDFLAASVPAAKAYFNETRRVNISQLAKYCESKVHADFHRQTAEEKAASDAGKRRHAEILRT